MPFTSAVRRSGGLGKTRSRVRRLAPASFKRTPAATAWAAVRNVGPVCFGLVFGCCFGSSSAGVWKTSGSGSGS